MQKFKSLFKSTKEEEDVESKPVEEWTVSDFQNWLKKHNYQKKVTQILKKEEWNGKCLISFTEDDLKKLGIPSGAAKGIANAINQLKEQQDPQSGGSRSQSVRQRIEHEDINGATSSSTTNNTNQHQDLDNDIDNKVVQLLDDEEKEEEIKLHQARERSQTRDRSGTKKNIFSSNSESTVSAGNQAEEKYVACPPYHISTFSKEEKEAYEKCLKKVQLACSEYPPSVQGTITQDCIFPDRFQYRYFNPLRLSEKERQINRSQEPFVKVKLIITEMDSGMTHRLIRKIGSRVHKTIKSMDYGMFHTALIVGVYYIEWVDSSLVTVRKKSSSKAVFCIDVGKVSGQDNCNELFKKLSKLVTEWNKTKEYDNKTANCQHFCTEAIEVMGLKDAYEKNVNQGPLKEYLLRLKNTGACEMSYKISQDVKETLCESENINEELLEFLKDSGNALTFSKHRQLDMFVHLLQEEDPLYFDREPFDYALLKAYDRAFWLRSQSKGHDHDACHYWEEGSTGLCLCPFNKNAASIESEEINNSIIGKDYEFGDYRPCYPIRDFQLDDNDDFQ
ncbi:hypothetical protein ABK040_004468 [Willaertia magna]